MMLTRVEYLLFESDAAWLDSDPERSYHTLDREVRLRFVDRSPVYISWKQKERDFQIAFDAKSFFLGEAPVTRDVSAHKFWQPLIGNELFLEYTDSERQVLRVGTNSQSVYLCAYGDESWGMDVVHIARQPPPNNSLNSDAQTARAG